MGGYTKIGGALLVMGIVGGAIFPLMYGAWAGAINDANLANGVAETAKSGNQIAYLILIPAYLMITFYAFKGYTYRIWGKE